MILGYDTGLPLPVLTTLVASVFLCLFVLSWDLAEITLFVAARLVAIGLAAIAIETTDQYQFQFFVVLPGLYALPLGLFELVNQVRVVVERHEIEDNQPKSRPNNSQISYGKILPVLS